MCDDVKCSVCHDKAGEGLNYLQWNDELEVWICIECLETAEGE